MAVNRSRARAARRPRSSRSGTSRRPGIGRAAARAKPRPARTRAVPTYGLTHIALAVRDADRAFEFYRKVFGMVATYRNAGWIQAQIPGHRDLFVFDQGAPHRGKAGGIAHFGFRLVRPGDLDAAARAIRRAGGAITSRGLFTSEEPYLFCRDLDGYDVEVVFEPRTPLDPPVMNARRAPRRRG
jgi:catechol 2,3-dioxygenase-like lactoylglutathione lyase family enzyme